MIDEYILLDRTDISGFFWLKKINPSLTLNQFCSYKLSGGVSNVIELIKPSIIFVLNADIDTLLSRNNDRCEKNESLKNEREKTIVYNHNLYNSILNECKDLFDICSIDGNLSKSLVTKNIINVLCEKGII